MSHRNIISIQSRLRDKLKNIEKTICLNMIVKNESKNMVRLLDSVKSIIDFVSIVDTGSTDNTVEIIENWCQTNKILYKIHHELFKDFGYNRTQSIIKARESFPQANFFLLSDADFIWKIDARFNKKLLFDHKYTILQDNNSLVYSNIRLLNSEVDWVCRGVTHEYWEESRKNNRYTGEIKTASIDTIYIIDVEDGGCKLDKFERDKKLLKIELKKEDVEKDLIPRYYFYLAQTYKCLDKYTKSIQNYSKRIEYDGWNEEIYYSKYQIGLNYMELFYIYKSLLISANKQERQEMDIIFLKKWKVDDLPINDIEKIKQEYFDKTKLYLLNAWKYRPIRNEALYALVMFLRELSYHQEAYDYAKEGLKVKSCSDSLFVEHKCYKWSFEFEISILAFYVNQKQEGMEMCEFLLELDELPEYNRNVVENNCKFYI